MVQVFKDYRQMINHLRGKEVEIKHKAVKVEDIMKKKAEKAEEKPAEKPKKKAKKKEK